MRTRIVQRATTTGKIKAHGTGVIIIIPVADAKPFDGQDVEVVTERLWAHGACKVRADNKVGVISVKRATVDRVYTKQELDIGLRIALEMRVKTPVKAGG